MASYWNPSWPLAWRLPRHKHPHVLQTLLAVAVFNDQMPAASSVQGFQLLGSSLGPLVANIPGLAVSGITPGDLNNPFYLQSAFELLNGGNVLSPTVAQAGPGGAFSPMYWLNTITYSGGNLFVIGDTQTNFGVLCYDATTGNPNGSGTNPTTDPLYLSLNQVLANTGMSAISLAGQSALLIPFVTGLGVCQIGAVGAPTLNFTIPYSAFQAQGLPLNLALIAPGLSPSGQTVYAPFFDLSNPGSAGLISVTVTALEQAALQLSGNPQANVSVPVSVICQLGALPLTCAWCVGTFQGQDVVFVALPGWPGPFYSIQFVVPSQATATTPATVQTVVASQNMPGQAWGMCVATLSM